MTKLIVPLIYEGRFVEQNVDEVKYRPLVQTDHQATYGSAA